MSTCATRKVAANGKVSAADIKPLNEEVFVRVPLTLETEGGIAIPQRSQIARESLIRGQVVAVGTGFLTLDGNRTKLYVQEGDWVFFQRQAAEPVGYLIAEDNDEFAYYLVKEGHCKAKVTSNGD